MMKMKMISINDNSSVKYITTALKFYNYKLEQQRNENVYVENLKIMTI